MTVDFECSLLRAVYSDGPVLSNDTIKKLVNDSQFLTDFISGDLTAVAKVFRSLVGNAKAFVNQIDLSALDKNDVLEASRFFAILYSETRKLTSDENWATAFVPVMLFGVQKHIESLKEQHKKDAEVLFSIKEEINDESLKIVSKEAVKKSMLRLNKSLKILFGTSYSNGRRLTRLLAEDPNYLQDTYFSYNHEACSATRDCKNISNNPEAFAEFVTNITLKKNTETVDSTKESE